MAGEAYTAGMSTWVSASGTNPRGRWEGQRSVSWGGEGSQRYPLGGGEVDEGTTVQTAQVHHLAETPTLPLPACTP